MEKLDKVFFFQLDKAIKSYRQFAQKRLNDKGFDITIDQWVVIKTILDYDGITQNEIAAHIFKDKASVTRIIDILVGKGYLSRSLSTENRRKVVLTITKAGNEMIKKITPTIRKNRELALVNCNEKELKSINKTLEKIISNCS